MVTSTSYLPEDENENGNGNENENVLLHELAKDNVVPQKTL